jgi:N-acyl-D-aspartate/D-glutamate deacylase
VVFQIRRLPLARFDILIKSGTVVDGTRLPRYKADIAIKDGKIAQIGGRLLESDADRVLAGRSIVRTCSTPSAGPFSAPPH